MTGAPVGAAVSFRRANDTAGRIVMWQGGSLWIGHGRGTTDWHAHHAHQLALAPSGTFRFRTEPDGAWVAFEGAVVPSHCAHQFEVDGLAIAHLFVEPESRAGRALTARHGRHAVASLAPSESHAAARMLFDALAGTPTRAALVAAGQRVVARLCGADTEPDRELDPRLAAALALIRERVREPLALPDVAAAVGLSPSRFRHLFVEQTGSPFRAYLLWLRINAAIEAAMAGATWTEAAHEAGFADSAHLARTHRRVFGIEPTAIRRQGPPMSA